MLRSTNKLVVQLRAYVDEQLNISGGELLARVQGFLYEVTLGTPHDRFRNRVDLPWSLNLGYGFQVLHVLRLLGLTELFRFRIAHWFKLYLNLSIQN